MSLHKLNHGPRVNCSSPHLCSLEGPRKRHFGNNSRRDCKRTRANSAPRYMKCHNSFHSGCVFPIPHAERHSIADFLMTWIIMVREKQKSQTTRQQPTPLLAFSSSLTIFDASPLTSRGKGGILNSTLFPFALPLTLWVVVAAFDVTVPPTPFDIRISLPCLMISSSSCVALALAFAFSLGSLLFFRRFPEEP